MDETGFLESYYIILTTKRLRTPIFDRQRPRFLLTQQKRKPMAQEKSKVTIYDVADHAGVAISTVSRVLNNSPDVSDRTRARVLEAIDLLQFRPDRVAKSLAQQRTRAIAIAIPTFTTPFHNELLKGVRSKLLDQDHDLLLFDLGSTSPLERLLDMLNHGAVDGLLLAGVPVDEKLAPELKALRAPVVLVGHHHTEFDCFYWDHSIGAKAAVTHLIKQGHRRIGMIRSYTDSYLQRMRIDGYRQALDEAGIPYDEHFVQSGTTEKHAGFSEEHGYEAMLRLLEIDPPLTAVFASSDVQAIGAGKAIREAGKAIPEHLALVGYDDIKTSKFLGLSSLDQNMEGVGQEAAERLLYRLDHPGTKERIARLIIPALQIRESSRYHRPS